MTAKARSLALYFLIASTLSACCGWGSRPGKGAPACCGGAPKAAAVTPKAEPAAEPQRLATHNPVLYSTLYMQSSAEYEALCLQVYRQALDHVLAEAARLKQNGKAGDKKPAVVMDLDETVLDNGWYQAEAMRRGIVGYDPKLWNEFIFNHVDKVRLVPGARDFIHSCEAAGVRVCFISNRTEDQHEVTCRTLEGLGLAAQDLRDTASLRMQLKGLNSKTGNKDARRDRLAAHYNIIALVGDNLGDLSGEFDKGAPGLNNAAARRLQLERRAAELGRRWFVLPNPLYGEWEKFIDKQNPVNSLYQ